VGGVNVGSVMDASLLQTKGTRRCHGFARVDPMVIDDKFRSKEIGLDFANIGRVVRVYVATGGHVVGGAFVARYPLRTEQQQVVALHIVIETKFVGRELAHETLLPTGDDTLDEQPLTQAFCHKGSKCR
jgi:hypothetical protein